MRVYLDLDGVLADFDKAAGEILQTDNIYKFEFVHGTGEFWSRLSAAGDFFDRVPMLPDAPVLLWHLRNVKTSILTALPKTNTELVRAHKTAWVRRNIDSTIQVITCSTYEKPEHCFPGDVLIDDRAVNRSAWEARGGRYVVHKDAWSSVRALKDMGVILN